MKIKRSILKKAGLSSIIHQNVQSLGNSVDKINEMLQDHEDCRIMCISEHWKSEGQLENLGIRNFNLISAFCREEGKHGGSAIYVHKSVRAKKRPKLNKLSVCGIFECAVAECRIGEVNIVIVAIYRPPPGDLKQFMEKTEQLMLNISRENKAIFFAGDFNIEVLKDCKVGYELVSLLNSFNLVQAITENTRVTAGSGSCIDNIFTSSDIADSSTIEYFISDHKAQKVIFETKMVGISGDSKKRFFSQENKDNFLRCLRDQNWENVFNVNSNNVNKQWDSFISTFVRIFNQNFPLMPVKNKNPKPFKSHPEVVNCKQRLNLLLTLSHHNDQYKDAYKTTKKEYDDLLKNIKIKNYENRISSSDNKMKCMWTITKEITGKNSHNNDVQLEGSPETVANDFNVFLVNIIPNIVQKLEISPYRCNITNNNQSMFIKPLTPEEVCKLAGEIKNKHSSGVDEIPTSLIKYCVEEIKYVLCFLINNSFKFGIYPSQLKTALIKPLYKKGNPQKMDSYRPVSLLPGFSKFFELAMCKRIVTFLNRCNLINKNQHGFIRGKSTQTAIYQFVQSVVNHFERGEAALGIFLDLSKAYDCLDRDILLEKMERYGIRGQALNWVGSYLQDRKQLVGIHKNGQLSKSKVLSNNYGIAQGSIMGPVLFVIFVNDLYLVADEPWQTIINYADDTNLLIGNRRSCQLVADSKFLTSNVSAWFNENRLILNSEKTNLVLFRTKQSNFDKMESLETLGNTLKVSENTKFLGVYIDENLDWSCHIGRLQKKLGSICYGVRVVGRYMSEKALRVLYFANFESRLKYGIIFWGRDSKVQNIFVAQKRVIRIIKKMDLGQSCRNTFRSLGVMTVHALYIYECLMFFYKNKNSLFQNPHINRHNTRSNHQMYPTHRLQMTEKSPGYMCLKLYNRLPVEIKRLTSQKMFKRELKKMLIQLEPYCLDDYLSV